MVLCKTTPSKNPLLVQETYPVMIKIQANKHVLMFYAVVLCLCKISGSKHMDKQTSMFLCFHKRKLHQNIWEKKYKQTSMLLCFHTIIAHVLLASLCFNIAGQDITKTQKHMKPCEGGSQ